MSRQARIPLSKLKVEQMATWDDVPRRGLLIFLAVLLFLGVGFYVLMPQYLIWQQELVRIQSLQQQLIGVVKSSGDANSLNAPTVTILSDAELSLWAAQLANEAEKHNLQKISIKPLKVTSSSNTNDQDKPPLVSTAIIVVSAEGSYGNLLKWWINLSNQTMVLAMDDIELSGLSADKVRGQVSITFAYKGTS